MSTIKVNKDLFVDKFLAPIGRISDTATITIKPDSILSIVSIPNIDLAIYLIAMLNVTNELQKGTEQIKMNMGNIRKLISVLGFVKDETIELQINENNLAFESDSLNFKYHLLDDAAMRRNNINLAKLSNMTFDTHFEMSSDSVKNVLKGNVFVDNTQKIYLFSKDSKLYGDVTDKQVHNMDNITFELATAFTGPAIDKPVPVTLEIFRRMADIDGLPVKAHYNSAYGVFKFERSGTDFILQYIVSALVK